MLCIIVIIKAFCFVNTTFIIKKFIKIKIKEKNMFGIVILL